ncbi:hypothetical protein NFJ02_17g28310 [Pycnococcus provasolii]
MARRPPPPPPPPPRISHSCTRTAAAAAAAAAEISFDVTTLDDALLALEAETPSSTSNTQQQPEHTYDEREGEGEEEEEDYDDDEEEEEEEEEDDELGEEDAGSSSSTKTPPSAVSLLHKLEGKLYRGSVKNRDVPTALKQLREMAAPLLTLSPHELARASQGHAVRGVADEDISATAGALFVLGALASTGVAVSHGTPRDVPFARKAFRRAAALGSLEAMLAEADILAQDALSVDEAESDAAQEAHDAALNAAEATCSSGNNAATQQSVVRGSMEGTAGASSCPAAAATATTKESQSQTTTSPPPQTPQQTPQQKACPIYIHRLRQAAKDVLHETEASRNFGLPREAMRLRERFRDGGYAAHEQQMREEEEHGFIYDGGLSPFEDDGGSMPATAGSSGHETLEQLRGRYATQATEGSARAHLHEGYMSMQGLGGVQDLASAQRHFEAARAGGIPAAANALGVMALRSDPSDTEKARQLFEEAANSNDPDGHFHLGLLATQANEAARALKHFEAAHEAGHWRAPHSLAILVLNGDKDVPRNCTRGASLLRVFVEERLGWSADQDDAIKKFDKGDVFGALVHLGMLAAQGSGTAALNAAHVLSRHAKSAGVVADDQTAANLAEPLLLRAARSGCCAEGWGELGLRRLAAGDVAAAAHALRRGSLLGNAESRFHLARLFETGVGVRRRNMSEAASLYRQAISSAGSEAETVPSRVALLWLQLRRALRLVA